MQGEKTLSAPTVAPAADGARPRTRRRLLIGLLLIGLAVGGLVIMERVRERAPAEPAPHEPAQALMGTPPPLAVDEPAAPATEPPAPPVVVNESDPPAGPSAVAPRAPSLVRAPEGKSGYVVQAGVFASASNARSLQERLAKAGLRVKVETRVQLGPYPDRREAQQALDKLKALGIDGVMVPSR